MTINVLIRGFSFKLAMGNIGRVIDFAPSFCSLTRNDTAAALAAKVPLVTKVTLTIARADRARFMAPMTDAPDRLEESLKLTELWSWIVAMSLNAKKQTESAHEHA